MSLQKTMDTLGHYAKDAWNAVKRPLAYVSAATIILTTFEANEVQAQTNGLKSTNTEITETGYGGLFIKDENDQGIVGATITWTPVSIPGDSIPEPYVYTTDYYGDMSYEVLVFHDTGVGIQDKYNFEVIQARPNPSTDFTFNFISNQRPNNPVRVSNFEGKIVGKYNLTNYDNHVAVYHVDLSDKANGIYFATAFIDGKAQTSKIVKISGSYSGNLGSSAKETNNNFKNTNTEITETGYGSLVIQNENLNGIAGATITWTPVSIPGDSIPEPYEFISNGVGISDYEVLVFHDTGVGVTNNYDLNVVQARPNPSTDFTFNFISNKRPNNPIQISNIEGKTVGKYNLTNYDNHVAVYHVDLSDKVNGIYFATAFIDGKAQTSKIVKINGSYSGNLGSSAKEKNNNFKAATSDTAVYDITIEADGYYTLTDTRKVAEGDNGMDFYTLISDEEPPIDNIDIEGYVWALENTNNPLENAQVKVTVNSNGDEYTANSDSTGHFVVNGIPLGEEITFDIGGITGRYSFTGIDFTTPTTISNPADSVNSNFSAVLPLKLTSSSAQHIDDMTASGTNQDTILYYYKPEVSSTNRTTYNTWFTQLGLDEGGVYTFIESQTELTDKGIIIGNGTPNTQPYAEEIITPIGETLFPVKYANTTLNPISYEVFVHEIKRGVGYLEVSFNSVMETPVQNYTLEDKEIAEFVARPYEIALYEQGKTWIKLDNISEDMNSKSPSQPVKNVKSGIDENIPDYFNPSTQN